MPIFVLVVCTVMVAMKWYFSAMLVFILFLGKKLWATIQEKAAGAAVLMAVAFLFRLCFPLSPAKLFLPLSRRDVPVGSLVKEFPPSPEWGQWWWTVLAGRWCKARYGSRRATTDLGCGLHLE